jgi:rare lipoprotein A
MEEYAFNAYRFAVHFLFIALTGFLSICNVIAQDSLKDKAPISKHVSKKIFYGAASFYSNKFNGRRTANGEIFSQLKFTCACNALPFGTWIKVTNTRNSHSVNVKVNDRLHPRVRRIVDLTRAAAQKLGYISGGLTRVRVEIIGKKSHPG